MYERSQVQKDVYLLLEKVRAGQYTDAEQILSSYSNAGDLLNHSFDDLRTPLGLAAAGTKDAEDMEWLILRGAEVNWRHDSHDSGLNINALTIAIEEGNVAAVAKLLEYGADITRSNPYKDSPLCVAIDARTPNGTSTDQFDVDSQQIVRLLLEYGADPNSTDWAWSGKTALHKAVQYFDSLQGFCLAGDLIPILLEAGADPLMPDASGITPLDICRLNKDTRSETLLMEAIAKRHKSDHEHS